MVVLGISDIEFDILGLDRFVVYWLWDLEGFDNPGTWTLSIGLCACVPAELRGGLHAGHSGWGARRREACQAGSQEKESTGDQAEGQHFCCISQYRVRCLCFRGFRYDCNYVGMYTCYVPSG